MMNFYDDEQAFHEAQAEYMDRYVPMATMSDAHREWHLNSGVPMGQPGCPQDACHPVDEYDEAEEEAKFGQQDADYWSPVEQGFYDDDPNPYHGDYSDW